MPSNREFVSGLRDLADWLEAHPELPDASLASLYFFASGFYGPNPRRVLTAVADALEAPCESVDDNEVQIRGTFGPVSVRAKARLQDLGARPAVVVAPEYEPIIRAERVGV